jgi:hypothetical protein
LKVIFASPVKQTFEYVDPFVLKSTTNLTPLGGTTVIGGVIFHILEATIAEAIEPVPHAKVSASTPRS